MASIMATVKQKVSDDLHRQAGAAAAQRGQTLRKFAIRALTKRSQEQRANAIGTRRADNPPR
jgi:hypothetical protein